MEYLIEFKQTSSNLLQSDAVASRSALFKHISVIYISAQTTTSHSFMNRLYDLCTVTSELSRCTYIKKYLGKNGFLYILYG
jgi:hypothetical protein